MSISDVYYSLGYHMLSEYSKKHNHVENAIDFMVKHCDSANWGVVERAMEVLAEPRQISEHTEKFWKFVTERMDFHFRQDMIYCGICYDGFRL